MGKFSVENETKLLEIENYLANNQYLSGNDKPDGEDLEVFKALHSRKPEQPNWEKYPNTFAWFGWLNMFNQQYLEELSGKKGGDKPAAAAAGKGKPAAAAKPAEDDDFDPFAEDNETEEQKQQKAKEKKEAQEKAKAAAEAKKKPKATPKTIIVYNIKVFEIEQDLDKLADKVRAEVQVDGLVWYQTHKLIDVAFGIKMLELGCVVEDDKVSSDDIIEKIQSWEDEVQSVDIASMQKL